MQGKPGGKKPKWLRLMLPRTLGQMMAVVGLCGLGFAALAPRPAVVGPGPVALTRARPVLRLTGPRHDPDTRRDERPLVIVTARLDEGILVEAPTGIDEAMLVEPERLRGAPTPAPAAVPLWTTPGR